MTDYELQLRDLETGEVISEGTYSDKALNLIIRNIKSGTGLPLVQQAEAQDYTDALAEQLSSR